MTKLYLEKNSEFRLYYQSGFHFDQDDREEVPSYITIASAKTVSDLREQLRMYIASKPTEEFELKISKPTLEAFEQFDTRNDLEKIVGKHNTFVREELIKKYKDYMND